MILTESNYFSREADMKYLSVSQYKTFVNECEAKGLALAKKEYGNYDKMVFLLGNYFHAWAEGKLEEFIEKNSSKIMMKSKKDKLAQFREVDEIIKRLENNPTQYKRILDIIRNKNNKKEQIFTGKLFENEWKIKIDVYNPINGYFCDFKLVKSINDKFYNIFKNKYENFILHYGYDIQMYIYSQIEKIANNREKILTPIIACITKENPIDTSLFIGFEDIFDNQEFIDIIKLNSDRIVSIKNGDIEPMYCDKCDYCRSIRETKIMKYNFNI